MGERRRMVPGRPFMMDVARHVEEMAARMRLVLSEPELAVVIETVKKTGSLAPEGEVVSRFKQGALTSEVLTFFLSRMWLHRKDDSPVPADVWREMFRRARYTEDTIVRLRPKKAVRAYRGATEANREGLSWSLDPNQARYFARSRQAPDADTARVWVTDIPAERVLARYMNGWEQEITADVRGLSIRPVEDEHLLQRLPWWSRRR